MHTFGETGAGVPAFLAKLWRLVDDPDTNSLICWSKDGRSFIIQNQAQFARELLPLNYKHNNMASFIRQLNMYGFHKITSIDNGGLKFDRDEMEFSHPCFKRNCPYLLEHIKRKIATTKATEEKSVLKPEAVTKVLQDVKAMRGRQDSLDSRFSIMKQENEALWREIASLRQKHAKQQQIVNKLIQFLITIVQPSRNMSGVKRHMQLMINDTPESVNFRKTSESESECGPVIHELGEELLDEVADADSELMDPVSPYARNAATNAGGESPSPLHMERPQSSISVTSQNYDYSNQSAEDVLASVQGNNVAGLGNQRNISPMSASRTPTSSNSSVVQTVNADGSKIVYHVTEVPDTHPNESEVNVTSSMPSFSDENVLTTPMVREQMARSQMLKQKNKQRRQQMENSGGTASPIPSSGKDPSFKQTSPKQMCISPRQQQPPQSQQQQQQKDKIAVKIEPDIDPMFFLNNYDENRGMTPDPQLISPNLSEDSTQSGNANISGTNVPTKLRSNGTDMTSLSTTLGSGTPTNLYNSGDFLTESMPTDIFDDSSLISGTGDNSNFCDNFKMDEQQQYGNEMAKNGKFASFIPVGQAAEGQADALAEVSMPSTSAAAQASTGTNDPKAGNNMAVTKYKNGNGPKEEIMRLSTADEVHGHLESVQDELESLKDLLRSDGYSLDTNTLMSLGTTGSGSTINSALYPQDTEFLTKLFNDSDILGAYGLSLNTDLPVSSNDKKGSELMTYQPVYDLSDILDKESDSDAVNTPSSSRQLTAPSPTPSSSVLNTPYHE